MTASGVAEEGSEGVEQPAAVIRDVWKCNLEQEFANVRRVVKQYPYIAMDTEFPGVVARPLGEFRSTTAFQYQALRCNVDMLRLIQAGLTFMNEQGEMAPDCSTWQFNFKFSLGEDMYSQESIDLLQRSGIQFAKHEKEGIRIEDFGELLLTSGLVLTDKVTWLSFHSGYDFGYLMRTMLLKPLPTDEPDFFNLLRLIFPSVFDIKQLLKQPAPKNANLKGGLQELADQLQVGRIGPQHQAGSDSLLTGMTFFKIKNTFFGDGWQSVARQVEGQLFGLTASGSVSPPFDQCAPYAVSAAGGARRSPTGSSTPSGSTQDSSAELLSDAPVCAVADVSHDAAASAPSSQSQ